MGTNTKVICTKSKIEDIASAVRLRNNTQSTYTLDTLATAVNGLNNKYTITFARATPNATITATKSGVSYSTTSDSNGGGSIDVYDYGTWVVVDVTTSKSIEVIFEKAHQITFSNVPNTYQEVEYIESSGTQYIDTGINPTDNIELQLSFDNDTTGTNYFLFGSRVTTSTEQFSCYRDSSGNYNARYQNGNINSHLSNSNYISLKKDQFVVDTTIETFSYSLTSNSYNIFLFAINTAGAVSTNKAKYQLKNCKIYNNDVLVREFIPCYRKSDNKVGVYDTVNSEFLTSPNGADFVAGPNIN